MRHRSLFVSPLSNGIGDRKGKLRSWFRFGQLGDRDSTDGIVRQSDTGLSFPWVSSPSSLPLPTFYRRLNDYIIKQARANGRGRLYLRLMNAICFVRPSSIWRIEFAWIDYAETIREYLEPWPGLHHPGTREKRTCSSRLNSRLIANDYETSLG